MLADQARQRATRNVAVCAFFAGHTMPWKPEHYFDASEFCAHHMPILPNNMVENILGDIQTFFDSRAFYSRMGVPYRRGYLFHGVPGSGKTTLTRRIAAHFAMSICVLSLSRRSFYDNDLADAFSKTPRRALILIEDIDSAFKNDASGTSKKSKCSLSALLNAIDGVTSPVGTILIITTNHPDRLPPALKRTGRIDMQYEFTHVRQREAIAAFQHCFPNTPEAAASEFGTAAESSKCTMSDVQGCLLLHRTDPDAAVPACTGT
jgi:chaperone BCS1